MSIFNSVRFHAVRRAMLENETVLERFIDEVAKDYPEARLETLDKLLIEISDNDLFDLMLANKLPKAYSGDMLELCREMMTFAQQFSERLK
jgi:succinate dehydrogenase flavin-adding protein (antitoxin of CptAB toxin-antitoxin module)